MDARTAASASDTGAPRVEIPAGGADSPFDFPAHADSESPRRTPAVRTEKRRATGLFAVGVEDTGDLSSIVQDDERRDASFAHFCAGVVELRVGMHANRITRHDSRDRFVEDVALGQHLPTQVTIRHDSGQMPVIRDDCQAQATAAHLVENVSHRGVLLHDRQILRVHGVADAREELATQRTTGVEPGEIVGAEVALAHQGDGNRVAHGQCGQGRIRRREVVRADLGVDRDVQRHVGGAAQTRVGLADHGDDRDTACFEVRDQANDLFGLTAVGQHQDQITASDHAEVAVVGLSGVDREAGGAGRCERRGDLLTDETRLAHADHDHVTAGSEDQVDGVIEGLVEARTQGQDRVGLRTDDLAGRLEPLVGSRVGADVDRRGRGRVQAHPRARFAGRGDRRMGNVDGVKSGHV